MTGYDDYRYSTICSPQLTSYRVDLDGMAKTVVAQLRRKMAHKPAIAPPVIVPGGFGDRGIEGMIQAAQYARENNVPYFGICLGMQIMVMEFARHVLGYADANSSEFTPNGAHNVIALMADQKGNIPKGGTMRLGKYPCKVLPGTKMAECYGESEIWELPGRNFHLGAQFHPEFKSRPNRAHPLFKAFIAAALKYRSAEQRSMMHM